MELEDFDGEQSTLSSPTENTFQLGVDAGLIELPPERRPYRNEVTHYREWEIDSTRLPDHIHAPPGPRGDSSWVYNYGPALFSKTKQKKQWLCMECWNGRPSKLLLVDCDKATTGPARHLKKAHHIYKDGKHKSQGQNIVRMLSTPSAANTQKSVTPERIYYRILDWITASNLPMKHASSSKFLALFNDASPIAASYLRTGNDFIPRLVRKAAKCFRKRVQQLLRRSKNKIHITCDIWKSDNELSLLGVVAHYIDANMEFKTVLLGLKELEGSHTGENIGDLLREILRSYEIDHIGFFVLDNASNNDTAIQYLEDLDDLQINALEQRLRCSGHVIQLVAKAMLFGSDTEVFEAILQELEEGRFSLYLNTFQHANFEQSELYHGNLVHASGKPNALRTT
jgi:hypothetical protein